MTATCDATLGGVHRDGQIFGAVDGVALVVGERALIAYQVWRGLGEGPASVGHFASQQEDHCPEEK